MKQKFRFITGSEEKIIYLKKCGKSYIAYYNNEAYSPTPSGTVVEFNGNTKVVDPRVIYFDVEGTKFVTYYNGFAGAKITPDKGTKVKANIIANNMAASFVLFIFFLVLIIFIIFLVFKGVI